LTKGRIAGDFHGDNEYDTSQSGALQSAVIEDWMIPFCFPSNVTSIGSAVLRHIRVTDTQTHWPRYVRNLWQ